MDVVKRWIVIATVEILMSLVLIAIAPVFLNSNYPLIGFLLWLLVFCLLIGSILYVITQVVDAFKARQILVARFPDYGYLGVFDFLELPSTQVAEHLDMLAIMREDPDLQLHNESPIEVLRRVIKQ
ncbi:MAG: hypothetical protein NZ772_09155 [Cyanobacteria bacterium]|nr:hypothetical protein [Cyanobacteriota bacterium]MDW8201635.1 hypothetical protein [Cyanobacteriota bacterium SKYGB_h_bin112]